jgi:hypothetical protein
MEHLAEMLKFLFFFVSLLGVIIMTENQIREIFKDYNFNLEKDINDLITEVMKKETKIEIINNIPTRVLSIGICNIIYNNFQLIEVEQKFNNGKIRNRNQPVAGKLRYTEDPKLEMIREIHEELDIDLNEIDIEFIEKKTTHNMSPYYPGVPVIWHEHIYKWCMPEHLYKDEYVEVDNKKTSTFQWIPL